MRPHPAPSSQKAKYLLVLTQRACLLRRRCSARSSAAHLALSAKLQLHFQGQLSSNPLLNKQSHIFMKAIVQGELLQHVISVCSCTYRCPPSNWTMCNDYKNNNPLLYFWHACCVPGTVLDASNSLSYNQHNSLYRYCQHFADGECELLSERLNLLRT